MAHRAVIFAIAAQLSCFILLPYLLVHECR